MRTAWAVGIGTSVVVLLVGTIAVVPAHSDGSAPMFPAARVDTDLSFATEAEADAVRTAALSSAAVWMPVDVARAELGANPPDPGGALSQDIVRCRFHPTQLDGTTAKFRCVLHNGEVVRVKSSDTTEIPAEVAATRLLSALGFGADRVYVVPHLRCYGCPRWTFRSMWLADRLGARQLLAAVLPVDRFTDFRWVAAERHLPGVELATPQHEGWAWHELQSDETSPEERAERDALRLVARFLAHWDNKAANQRLVCRSTSQTQDVRLKADATYGTTRSATYGASRCGAPFAFIQDLGATFGPRKMDLDGWQRTAIWADRDACRVTMRDLPYAGGTFQDVEISEAGRSLLARQLSALADRQISALFSGARVAEFYGAARSGDVAAWTAVFKEKVRAIASGPACPS